MYREYLDKKELKKLKNRERAAIYYKNNKEKLTERRRIKYQENKEYYKNLIKKMEENRPPLLEIIYKKNNNIRAYKKNIKKFMVRNAKARALRNNMDFDITEEDITIPEICPYLKTRIITDHGGGRSGYGPSIDRVDNSKGYTKDNIEIISDKANKMKHNATKEELISFANYVLEKFGN